VTGTLELDQTQAEQIFHERIAPRYASRGSERDNPKLTIIGGQQGAGKTTLINNILSRSNTASIQRLVVDDLVPHIPGYADAARQNVLDAQTQVGNTPQIWGEMLLEHAFKNRHDIVLELANVDGVQSFLYEAAEHGYQTDLRIVATSKHDSWTGVLNRFDRSLANQGNSLTHFIDREGHDKTYDEWPNIVLQAEQRGVDEISIVRRDNSILFDNRLDRKKGQGGWLKPMGAYEVLMLERHRHITPAEDLALTAIWGRLMKSQHLADNHATENMDLSAQWQQIRADFSHFNILNSALGNSREQAQSWLNQLRQDVKGHLNADNCITDQDNLQRVSNFLTVAKIHVAERVHEASQVSHLASQDIQARQAARRFA